MSAASGLRLAAFLLALFAIQQSDALAQAPRARRSPNAPLSRPKVSPYLNLLRTGEGPLPNYYSLVRPELDIRSGVDRNTQSLSNIQRQMQSQGKGQRSFGQNAIRATGHGSAFQNTQSFFPQQSAGRRSSGR